MNDLLKEYLDNVEKLEKLNREIDQFYLRKIEKLETKIEKLESSLQFYKSRCELFQKVQKYMEDPERTIVCDILANNSLLPDPNGTRYGQDLRKLCS